VGTKAAESPISLILLNMQLTVAFLSLASFFSTVHAATYSRTEQIVGSGFNSAFDYQAIADPTHGRVNYVNQQTAQSQNLTYASSNSFILRADFTNVVRSGSGRNSVRIRSKRTYTTHVAVFDIRHMPQGCGTWPAVWEVKEDGWPNGGEIDILEGVNDQSPNAATLHTTSGCTMPGDTSQMTGSWRQTDCNWQVNGNAGCGVGFRDNRSYGPAFNSNGGGIYALERTPRFIKVWFWPRGSSIPSDVANGAGSVNTDNWGTPAAYFPNTSCNIPNYFAAHNIIINLTLCGDWAGSVYPSSCPSNCVDHVNNDPSSFRDAYFDFKSLNIYT
jgi:hypothetical protein